MTVIEEEAAVGTLHTPSAPPQLDAGGLPPGENHHQPSGGWRWIPDPDEVTLPRPTTEHETSRSVIVLTALAWASLHSR